MSFYGIHINQTMKKDTVNWLYVLNLIHKDISVSMPSSRLYSAQLISNPIFILVKFSTICYFIGDTFVLNMPVAPMYDVVG